MNIKKIINSLILKLSEKYDVNLHYFLKSGFWVFLKQAGGIISGLLLSVVYARLLTKETYGQYEYVLSILATFAIFSLPGLNTSVFQATAKGYEGSYPKAVKLSFLACLLGVPVIGALGFYSLINRNQALGLSLIISALFFPLIYAPNTWNIFLLGKERFDLSAKYSLVMTFVSTFAKIVVIFLFPNSLLAIITVYLFITSFFNSVWFWKSLKHIRYPKEDPDTLSYGWFLTKINSLSFLTSHLDKILVGIFLGSTELAVYAIGVNFVQKVLDFVKSLLATASPKIAQKSTVSLRNYMVIFSLALLPTILITLALPFIIPWLYSSKYQGAVFLSQVVIIFLPFYIVNILYQNHFLFYLKDRKVIFGQAVFLPISKIVLAIPLLYFFQAKGLAFLIGFQSVLSMLTLTTISRLGKRGVGNRDTFN